MLERRKNWVPIFKFFRKYFVQVWAEVFILYSLILQMKETNYPKLMLSIIGIERYQFPIPLDLSRMI